MSISELRLIKSVLEYQPIENIHLVPIKTRGIYALYQEQEGGKVYDLVYVGMARGKESGIKGRLSKHRKRKRDLWSHFSVYEVWDNIKEDEVEELEGLFRHLFKHDSKANSLNIQKTYKKLVRIRRDTEQRWK
jgi:adenosyl cobinamide kinase/adenosyl cobinamide phosphate guanylyltransferase